jgi:TonB family protein
MIKLLVSLVFLVSMSFTVLAQDQKTPTGSGQGSGTGSGSGRGVGTTKKEDAVTKKVPEIPAPTNRSLTILSKPRAVYTDRARANQVQGKVILKITFKSNGEIGNIKVVRGLPDGLTENAINAAKWIRFQPEIKKRKPITVTKNIEYSFTIY